MTTPHSSCYLKLSILTHKEAQPCTLAREDKDKEVVWGQTYLVAGPRLWNDLKERLKSSSFVDCIKEELNTHLVRKAFNPFGAAFIF